jgi:hypothetical protein
MACAMEPVRLAQSERAPRANAEVRARVANELAVFSTCMLVAVSRLLTRGCDTLVPFRAIGQPWRLA